MTKSLKGFKKLVWAKRVRRSFRTQGSCIFCLLGSI